MGTPIKGKMEVTALDTLGIKLLTPRRFRDERGFFSETYNNRVLCGLGIDVEFVQDNHSLSVAKGTVRGLHFQAPPFAQDKLVRVVRGRILDIAVDIRKGSPTYGQAVSAVLSAEDGNQLFVPKGFAHGFCTLEPGTEVIYKVSDYYAPEHDLGTLWNDPDLGIVWPVREEQAILADKDRTWPRLGELPDVFVYGRD